MTGDQGGEPDGGGRRLAIPSGSGAVKRRALSSDSFGRIHYLLSLSMVDLSEPMLAAFPGLPSCGPVSPPDVAGTADTPLLWDGRTAPHPAKAASINPAIRNLIFSLSYVGPA